MRDPAIPWIQRIRLNHQHQAPSFHEIPSIRERQIGDHLRGQANRTWECSIRALNPDSSDLRNQSTRDHSDL